MTQPYEHTLADAIHNLIVALGPLPLGSFIRIDTLGQVQLNMRQFGFRSGTPEAIACYLGMIEQGADPGATAAAIDGLVEPLSDDPRD